MTTKARTRQKLSIVKCTLASNEDGQYESKPIYSKAVYVNFRAQHDFLQIVTQKFKNICSRGECNYNQKETFWAPCSQYEELLKLSTDIQLQEFYEFLEK